jgi:two-component system sensor histidine kinase/response regulator
MRSLAAGVALSLVAVLLASWNAWAAYRSLALVARSDIQLTRQGGEIMRLDELLTMSARLGAATGDPKWEERYRRWEPVLDQQIKASIALDGEFGVESSSATDAANRRLVEMENQAFALVRAGERDAAFRLLASPEYESQKLIYAQGNEATLTSARDRIDKRLALHSRRARASVVFTLALGLLLAIAWLRIIHMVQHHLDARATAEDEALSAKREAQEATRAKSAFLANMSHELRTPMNGVLGCTELLAATGLNEEQRLYVATVRDSSQTLLSLLDDILDISKIEAGKLALELIPVDLPTLIEETTSLVALRAAGKPVEVVARVSPGVPEWLMGDPVRLRQIVLNLASNAVKFTSRGHVVVAVELVERQGDSVLLELSVRDTGIGIPADRLGRLFRSFSQADPSTTREFGGTGLGLAISKQLAEMMGGELGVESAPGEGSRFWMRLRLGLAPPVPTSSSVDLNELKGRRVAMIDLRSTSALALEERFFVWGLLPVHVPPTDIELAQIADVDLVVVDEATLIAPGVVHCMSSPGWPVAKVLLYASLGNDAQGSRPFAGVIGKPLRRRQLAQQLVTVLQTDREKPRRDSGSRHLAPPMAGTKVLLAEDNAVNLLVACRMLEQLGCTVEAARNGNEAWERARAQDYDLIFMDCQMPGMDGFEVTAKIREAEGPRHVPIVALTANAMRGDHERCVAAGMDDYLSKPMSQLDLQRVLTRWVPADRTSARAP